MKEEEVQGQFEIGTLKLGQVQSRETITETPFLMKKPRFLKYVNYFKSGHWVKTQTLKYAVFLDFHQERFKDRQNRRVFKVFKAMSDFIKTRDPDQCRSHHQKMERQFSTLKQIINQSWGSIKPFLRRQKTNRYRRQLTAADKQTKLDEAQDDSRQSFKHEIPLKYSPDENYGMQVGKFQQDQQKQASIVFSKSVYYPRDAINGTMENLYFKQPFYSQSEQVDAHIPLQKLHQDQILHEDQFAVKKQEGCAELQAIHSGYLGIPKHNMLLRQQRKKELIDKCNFQFFNWLKSALELQSINNWEHFNSTYKRPQSIEQ